MASTKDPFNSGRFCRQDNFFHSTDKRMKKMPFFYQECLAFYKTDILTNTSELEVTISHLKLDI